MQSTLLILRSSSSVHMDLDVRQPLDDGIEKGSMSAISHEVQRHERIHHNAVKQRRRATMNDTTSGRWNSIPAFSKGLRHRVPGLETRSKERHATLYLQVSGGGRSR